MKLAIHTEPFLRNTGIDGVHKTMLTEEKIREILKDKEELDSVAFFNKHYEYLDESLNELLATWLNHKKLVNALCPIKAATIYAVN